MTKLRSITEIGNLYESVLRQQAPIIEEKSKPKKFPKDTFPAAHETVKTTKAFNDAGPKGIKKLVKNKKNKKNTRKKVTENINSFMKSKFDKLFENVMDDDMDTDMDLGPGTGPEGSDDNESDLDLDIDSDMDSDMDSEEVTISMDKDTAQKLYDLIGAVLGGGEDMGDESDLDDLEIDTDSDMDDSDDDDMDFDNDMQREETGTEKLPDSAGHKLTKGMEASGSVKAGKGKASSDVTDDCGTETKGDPMKGTSPLTKPGTVSNLKPGSSFFGNK